MRKIVICKGGVTLHQFALAKERVTLGRRPHNDVILENLVVSGEHAVIATGDGGAFVEDLRSTNGTFLNGSRVTRQALRNNDWIHIGDYRIQYIDELAQEQPPATESLPHADVRSRGGIAPSGGRIRVLTGAAQGRDLPLMKVVTTIGKPGVAIAAITEFPHGFVVSQVDGPKPTVNGVEVGTEPVLLRHADVIELAGTRLEFLMHAAAG